jgi:HlyD family secretion protein
MKRFRPALVIIAIAALIGVAVWLIRGDREPDVLTGYVEGERIYLAAPQSGTVSALFVREGDRVAAGAPTFQIDPDAQRARVQSAEAGVEAARAQADDLRQGQREQELDVIDAELAAAGARLREAEAEYGRIAPLVARGIYAPARLDQVTAARDSARAEAEATRRRREVATLGARRNAIAAAEQQVRQAEGGLGEAQAGLGDLSPAAPIESRVEEIFFRQGEWAAANQPVMALLPDGEIKLRFFAPETEAARYRPGTEIRFNCDGCGGERTARITWISPRPEFSPPVLYSRSSRDRLVFMVEAAPANPRELNPGLPVDVTPLPEPDR